MTPGVWTQFEIDSDPAAGRWTLRLRDAQGRQAQLAGLPYASPGWHALRWFGFISYAELDTRSCLADVRLRYP